MNSKALEKNSVVRGLLGTVLERSLEKMTDKILKRHGSHFILRFSVLYEKSHRAKETPREKKSEKESQVREKDCTPQVKATASGYHGTSWNVMKY